MSGSLVLEIFLSGESLKMALLERAETLPSLKSLTSCHPDFGYIEKLCLEINSLLNQQNRKSFIGEQDLGELKKLGQLLFDHLLSKKVKQKLREKEDLSLTLNLDERLISIPWELLHTGEQFLCLKFNLGRSITVERELEPQGVNKHDLLLRMLIIADPTSDLESAYREGVKIKDFLLRYKNVQIDFKSSNVDSLYLKKNLRDYNLFHFAGHCEFDQNEPLESGLVLKDGRFTCKDILQFVPVKSFPRIVFVNACQSSKIENRDFKKDTARYIFSLAHSFLFCGSQHYIGSSFKVDDQLGAGFAQKFYSEILKGASIGYALRQARFGLIREYGWNKVAWVNYILYGDPDYVLIEPSLYKKSYIHLDIPEKKKSFLKLFVSVSVIILFLVFAFNYFNPGLNILYKRALNYFKAGRNDMVFEITDKIIRHYPGYPLVYRLLADTYFRLGKLDDALKNYFEYLRFAQKKKDFKNICSAYLKIAWTYHMQGEYFKAEDFYQKALDLSRKNKDKLNEADALSRFAVYYADKNDFQKALSLLIQSSEINLQKKQDRDFRFNLACDYFNLGWIFSEMKDLDKAKEFYNKSKDIFSRLGAVEELSDFYFNMGEIARFEKRYQEALDYYQRGLELDKRLSHYFNLSSDYQMLAELFWEMGNHLEAERYFLEAIKLCQKIKNLPVLAELYYELGFFYKEQNNSLKAKDYLIQAESLYRKMGLPEADKVKEEVLSLN